MGKRLKIEESAAFSCLLTLASGYIDGYSYFLRDGRFATMETGNLIMAVYSLAKGEWSSFAYYLIPIAGFLLGVFLFCLLRLFVDEKGVKGFTPLTLLLEMAFIIASSFIPLSSGLNIYSTLLLSFASAIQMEGFSHLRGVSYVSTMCTGNMQKMVREFSHAIKKHDKESLKNAISFLLVILCFALGAYFAFLIGDKLGSYSVLLSLFPLAVALLSSLIGGRTSAKEMEKEELEEVPESRL